MDSKTLAIEIAKILDKKKQEAVAMIPDIFGADDNKE